MIVNDKFAVSNNFPVFYFEKIWQKRLFARNDRPHEKQVYLKLTAHGKNPGERG